MKFEDAMKEIKAMFPPDTFYSFGFDVTEATPGKLEITCKACAIKPGEGDPMKRMVSYWKPTWQGVIDAFKIHLLPKGEGSIEEAPDEL